MVDTHIEALHVLLRETLLKKGFPSNFLPKTFSSVFSARGNPPERENGAVLFVWGYPLQKKQSWKSLERGLGKNLSPERFAPVVGINFCTSTGFNIRPFFVELFYLTYWQDCGRIIIYLSKGEYHEDKRFYPRFYRYPHTAR